MSGLTEHSATLHSILDMQRTHELGVPLVAPSRRGIVVNSGGIVEYETRILTISSP